MENIRFGTSFATPRNGGIMLGSVQVLVSDTLSPDPLIFEIPTWELPESDSREYEIKVAVALPKEQRLNYIELGPLRKLGEERGAPMEHWDVLEARVGKDIPILSKDWNGFCWGTSATQSVEGKFVLTIILYAGGPNSLIPMLVNRHDFDSQESSSLFSLFAQVIDKERRRGSCYRN